MLILPFFKFEYIKIPISNFSDHFTTMTLLYWQHNINKIGMGIFSKRKKNYFKDAYGPSNLKNLKYLETK